MGLVLASPTKLYLDFPDEVIDGVRKKLTFRDNAAQFAYTRFKKNRWYANSHGPEAFQEELDRLKKAVTVELLFEDDRGIYTYSGLREYLRPFLDEARVEVGYPGKEFLGYKGTAKVMRPYQEEAVSKLMMAKHGAIECCTGAGKTRILQELIKRHGLRSVIVTPSTSIARQIFREFKNIFGVNKVGLYGDGKHDLGKQITVGIAASLTRIKEESKEEKFFAGTEVLMIDESHTCGAETVKNVCLGPMSAAPYRYFVSATQMRNDGRDLLLESLIGSTVFEYTLKQAVDAGYLSKPNFFVQKVPTDTDFFSQDTLEMMRAHVYANKILHRTAADLANRFVRVYGHQVLIMIENVSQFPLLVNHLGYEVGFAHGGVTGANKDIMESRYHRSDVERLVDDFNAKKFPILVGTGCVGMGTDFQGVNMIVYLMGGKSEIKVSQAVGRGTRKPEGKTEFNFIDFSVDVDCPALNAQDRARVGIYESLYPGSVTVLS